MKKIILIFVLILLSALILTSCGNGDTNREAFSPESGQYKIMLKPDEWSVITMSLEQPVNQFAILHTKSETLLVLNCYNKLALKTQGVSDINDFYDYCKTIESEDESGGNGQNKKPGELINVRKKEMSGSAVIAGKRQKFYANNTDTGNIINEFIYLETEKYYISVVYGNSTDKFDASQKIANEVVSHIKTEA